jgi:protein-S-isoprenylcysteine O-methyltransferase Ste14
VALGVYATVTGEAGLGVLVMGAAAFGSAIALCLVLIGRVPTEWMTVGPFAFRPASRTATSSHLATTAVQLLVFWGLFLAVIPAGLVWLEQRWGLSMLFPPVATVAGIVVLTLASALGIWSAFSMAVRGGGTPLPAAMPNQLVVSGPYRFVRNPMAIAGIVQGVAVGLIVGSWVVVAYAIAGSLLWNYAVRPLEEADLDDRFGDAYRRYCALVRCWWPRIRAVD